MYTSFFYLYICCPFVIVVGVCFLLKRCVAFVGRRAASSENGIAVGGGVSACFRAAVAGVVGGWRDA